MSNPDSAGEDTLVSRIRAGDHRAFAELFHQYYAPLTRFVVRYIGVQNSAEDIVQEVLLNFWEKRGELLIRTSLSAYLYGAVRNRVLNEVARQKMIVRHAETMLNAELESSPLTVEDIIILQDLENAAERKIAELSPRLREIYRMSRDDGLSYAEISETLGITIETVYVQMGRALKALHKELAPWIE